MSFCEGCKTDQGEVRQVSCALCEEGVVTSETRTDFKDFEAKRRLLSTYDMFMAEKSILPMLPKVIGSNSSRRRNSLFRSR